MMKKYLFTILLILITFVLFGCVGKNTNKKYKITYDENISANKNECMENDIVKLKIKKSINNEFYEQLQKILLINKYDYQIGEINDFSQIKSDSNYYYIDYLVKQDIKIKTLYYLNIKKGIMFSWEMFNNIRYNIELKEPIFDTRLLFKHRAYDIDISKIECAWIDITTAVYVKFPDLYINNQHIDNIIDQNLEIQKKIIPYRYTPDDRGVSYLIYFKKFNPDYLYKFSFNIE